MLRAILMRVIERRIAAGEELEAILLDYSKLSEADKETIRANLSGEV